MPHCSALFSGEEVDRHLADQTSIVGAPHDPQVIAERLRLALTASGLGDWSWDVRSDLVTISRRAAEIFGVPHHPITWTAMRDLLHPDDRERARLAVDHAISDKITYDIEYRVIRPSGQRAWVAARGTGIYAHDGTVLGMVGVVQDITDRKDSEAAEREEARALEALQRTSVALSSTLDIQTLLQTVTDAATRVCGAQFGAFFYNTHDENGDAYQLYTLSGAPRSAFEKLGHPRATPIFAPTFNGEAIIRLDDVTADSRYGQWPPHKGMPRGHLPVRSYLAVPVRSRNGEILGGLFFGHPEVGMFSARAERLVGGIAAQAAAAIDNARLYVAATQSAEGERAARAQAEQAGKQKDDFLATLSHELRTPLNAILGWAQVLRRGGQNLDATTRQGLEIIERNTRLQAQLIEDLLDMSRITSGKMQLDVQTLMPSTFIEAAIDTVQPAAAAKNIRLVKVLDHSAGPIAGDPGRLQQVLWNLLSNAIKFTPKEGRVQVLLERVNSHIEISVSDTGAGIKPDFLPHVFGRFQQADASTTRRHGGLGLGLSIVKHLVELHGGSVSVHSPGENKGATFSVHLPLAATRGIDREGDRVHPRASLAPLNNFQMPNLAGVRVLVVDDEPDARDLVRHVLQDCGAVVSTCPDAKDGLAILERETFDVIVSDIGMPEIDGYEFLRLARQALDKTQRRIPAIALTAFARSEDRTRALQSGFLMHVSKPVEPSELAATVASVTDRTFT
jgi:PAS domain S-box-containing protein